MKRMLAGALTLLLLSGCARAEEPSLAEKLQTRYAELPEYRAAVTVTLPRGEERLRYVLDVTGSADMTRVTVREPEMLALVTAELTGKDLTLSYDGMTFDAGSAAPGLSAANCVPLLLRAAAEGFPVAENRESFRGRNALRLELESEETGETLLWTVWFGEADEPLCAEAAQDGKIILTAEFTNFEFGGILAETKE